MSRKVFLFFAAVVGVAGCGHQAGTKVPDISDAPVIGAARVKDIPEFIPGYGIVEGGRIVVNIEAEDTSRVHEGERAEAFVLPSTASISCRVTRTLRNVSAETNQSLAWLEPLSGTPLPANSFVSASVEVAVRRHALTVPRGAVMIRDGTTMVLRQTKGADGKISFVPTPVVMGVESLGDVEILTGLKPGMEIVTSGGIGLVFPEFKAEAD